LTFLGTTAAFHLPGSYSGPRGPRPVLDERRTVVEARTLLCHPVWRGTDLPRGDGLTVLLIPGFTVGDASLKLMSRWLGRMGYVTYRSKVHLNVDCTTATVDRLARRLELMAARGQRPVALVGQGLGGLLAKRVAIRRPDLVAGIVSLGSPHLASSGAHSSTACEPQGTFPPDVPFTSIYSRSDGRVDWRACLDPRAEAVEVQSSHVGMAVHPAVYRIVGERLASIASRPGEGRPRGRG
jgi:triacylglycerol lipase